MKLYPCIISQLENEVGSSETLSAAKSKILGYQRILKIVNFVVNIVFFKDILAPLSLLSLSLQKMSVSSVGSVTSLVLFYLSVEKLKKLCQPVEQVSKMRYTN